MKKTKKNTIMIVLFLLMCFTLFMLGNDAKSSEKDYLLRRDYSDIIPEGTLKAENNYYVELNNKMISAIDAYNNNDISKDEYLKIFHDIENELNNRDNKKTFEEDYKEFKEEEGVTNE